MSHPWKRWAEEALKLARKEPVPNVALIRALEAIAHTGAEPYWQLKAQVDRMRRGMP